VKSYTRARKTLGGCACEPESRNGKYTHLDSFNRTPRWDGNLWQRHPLASVFSFEAVGSRPLERTYDYKADCLLRPTPARARVLESGMVFLPVSKGWLTGQRPRISVLFRINCEPLCTSRRGSWIFFGTLSGDGLRLAEVEVRRGFGRPKQCFWLEQRREFEFSNRADAISYTG